LPTSFPFTSSCCWEANLFIHSNDQSFILSLEHPVLIRSCPRSVLFIDRRRHHYCNAKRKMNNRANNTWSLFYERTIRFTSENRATRENRLWRGCRFRGNSRILPGDLTNRKRSSIISLPGKAQWDIGWEILHRWRSLVSRSVNQPIASSAIGCGRSILIVVRNLAKASASDDAHRIIISYGQTLWGPV